MNVEQVLGGEGPLAQKFPGYKPRSGQIAMAVAVEDAFEGEHHLFVEGPTGSGKGVAYLVPAVIAASERGIRTVVATANIALQEQLVKKDLPGLHEVLAPLGCNFKFALFKGRSNFLCLDLVKGEKDPALLPLGEPRFTLEEQGQAAAISEWAAETESGDNSELAFQPTSAVWRTFSVGSDDCKGDACKFKKECFANLARAKALAADIVVTNYHLLWSDFVVQGNTAGHANVLGVYDALVLDEAHKAPDIARDYFGAQMSVGTVKWAVNDLLKLGEEDPAKYAISCAEHLFEELKVFYKSGKYKVRFRAPAPVDWRPLHGALEAAAEAYRKASKEALDELKPRLASRRGSVLKLAKNLSDCLQLANQGWVSFMTLDAKDRVHLALAPVAVGEFIAPIFEMVKTVVVTSATLTVSGSFDFIKREFGNPEAEVLEVPSPFDYLKQAVMIIPKMPPPPHESFKDEVGRVLIEVVRYARGRTLGLFTSYTGLNVAHQALIRSRCPYTVLRHGEAPRMLLAQKFKDDMHSVLLGTESFWAGVDVPGEACSAVVIDKFPFPSMDDPILDYIKEGNDAWFIQYSIPRAVIAFRQGAGRLIRSTTDRGVIVLLDCRAKTKSYGGIFTRSLPRMRWSDDLKVIGKFLADPVDS